MSRPEHQAPAEIVFLPFLPILKCTANDFSTMEKQKHRNTLQSKLSFKIGT